MQVKIEKELTVFNVEEVFEELKSNFSKEGKNMELELDLTTVEDIDGAGMQMLVALQKQGDSHDCDCRIIITGEMNRDMKKYGADTVLNLEVRE